MKLTKKQREELKRKFGGHCAYCGIELGERWQADHLEPVERNWETYKDKNGKLKTRATDMNKPENDHYDNLMPSCVKCNNDKHSMTLENWRYMIKDRIRTLNESPKYASYQKARRFGLVQETGAEVIFYFEKCAVKLNNRLV